MPADNTLETSQSTENTETQESRGKDPLANTLAEIQEQLKALNTKQEQGWQAIADANRRPEAPVEETNLYEPNNLLARAQEEARQIIKIDREKDMMIYNLAQEYPEIQKDSKVRQAVLDAQRDLPASIKDTAAGYEMAVLKAVSKAGIVAKSRRQNVDEDISMAPNGSNTQRAKGKVKVSDKMLQIAELMGRDINDPETLKRLEAAANRDSYTKYR